MWVRLAGTTGKIYFILNNTFYILFYITMLRMLVAVFRRP